MKKPDEKLWCILSVVFGEDSVYYSPEEIAKSCFDAGYTDMEHIRKVLLEELLPVCLIPLCLCPAIGGFKEEWIVLAANTHKKNPVSRAIMKFFLLFTSKKELNEILDRIEAELIRLRENA